MYIYVYVCIYIYVYIYIYIYVCILVACCVLISLSNYDHLFVTLSVGTPLGPYGIALGSMVYPVPEYSRNLCVVHRVDR